MSDAQPMPPPGWLDSSVGGRRQRRSQAFRSPTAALRPVPVLAAPGAVNRTMRRVLLPGMALILAACGGGATGEPISTSTPIAVTATAETTTTAVALETTTTEEETRTIEHELGFTEVPTDPQRIVVLNPYAVLDALLAVGVEPVGSTGDPLAAHPFAVWQEGLTDGIEMVGLTGEEDLEKIVLLDPDLILVNPWQEDTYDELSGIAPTVAVPLSYQDYEAEFRFVADLVDKGEEADAVIAAHHEHIAELRSALGDPSALAVSVVRVFPDQVRAGGGGYVFQLLDALGVSRPEGQRVPEQTEISLERLEEIDADVVVVYSAASASLEEDNAAARVVLLENPLWQQLDAAQGDRVFVVDSFLWGGGGILWAEAMLDDLEAILLEGGNSP